MIFFCSGMFFLRHSVVMIVLSFHWKVNEGEQLKRKED